jgi:Protein of unknown function (DUF4242)
VSRYKANSRQGRNEKENTIMPRYLIERDRYPTGRPPEERGAGARRAIEVAESMPGVAWIRSYVSSDKIYCEYEAPNPEAILEHARRAGLSVVQIIPIERETDPSMFR